MIDWNAWIPMIWLVVFWTGVIVWIVRRRRAGHSLPTPVAFVPISYAWSQIEPALLWIAYLWNGKRIARFLKLADDLRVREKRIDGLLPPSPDR